MQTLPTTLSTSHLGYMAGAAGFETFLAALASDPDTPIYQLAQRITAPLINSASSLWASVRRFGSPPSRL